MFVATIMPQGKGANKCVSKIEKRHKNPATSTLKITSILSWGYPFHLHVHKPLESSGGNKKEMGDGVLGVRDLHLIRCFQVIQL